VVRGPSPSCAIVGKRTVQGGRGPNRVRFLGRFRGRPLAPGVYGITLVAWRHGVRTSLGTISVEVVPPGRLGRTRGPAPTYTGCSSGISASSPSSGSPLLASSSMTGLAGVGRVPFRPPTLKPPAAPGGTIELGPPRLGIPHPSGALGWLGVLLVGALGIAGALFMVGVLRFVRGTWNP
jgi:hypothetical protein